MTCAVNHFMPVSTLTCCAAVPLAQASVGSCGSFASFHDDESAWKFYPGGACPAGCDQNRVENDESWNSLRRIEIFYRQWYLLNISEPCPRHRIGQKGIVKTKHIHIKSFQRAITRYRQACRRVEYDKVSEYIRRLVVTDAVANLTNSDKLQTHGLNIHTYSALWKWGRFCWQDEAEATIDDGIAIFQSAQIKSGCLYLASKNCYQF